MFSRFALFAVALLAINGCSDGTDDTSPVQDPAPPTAAEETGEVSQEAGGCPAILQCPNGYYQYMNVCDGSGKTTSFNCYTFGSATPYQLKPSKSCAYCYPYDDASPWCGYMSGLTSTPPWAKCYSAPK